MPVLATYVHAFGPRNVRARAIARHNEALRAVAVREKITLIDLARGFEQVEDKRALFQPDLYHPAAGAVSLIAEGLAIGLDTPVLGSRRTRIQSPKAGLPGD